VAGAASNLAQRCGVGIRGRLRTNEPAADALVAPLGVVVDNELPEQMTKMSLPEDHEVVQATRSERASPHVPLYAGMGTYSMPGIEKRRPRPGEEWVAIMDEVGRVAEEAVDRVEEVAGQLGHEGAVRIDADTCDMDRAELHSMTKKTIRRTMLNAPRVSTLKKSQTCKVSQWLLRNCRQVRLRDRRELTSPTAGGAVALSGPH